uniref:MYB binding protein 1a n=1 Tax=Anser cygnoides TaxID=8845 RepID=A0A8B9ENQ5_ANSCY
ARPRPGLPAAVPVSSSPSPRTSSGAARAGRAFLDFFWDIAKPEQEVRLAATENLLRHLRDGGKDEEMKYALKRLVEGLGATREAARPGFSLALAQVLQAFEEIPIFSVLEQIKEKHNLEKVKKKLVRNAAFGNFFGVMALFQSGRLVKDQKALLESIQLLQQLAHHQAHLKDLPRKTIVDILSEVPETVFEEVLFGVLQADLTSAFESPENLHLLLVGIQKFPGVLKPKKLKKLFGSPTIVNEENIPKLVELLQSAAKSEKKDKKLPSVGFDLLQVSLKEGAFELFWKEAVENGLFKEKSGPVSYMCYRLLGSALPLLSLDQLQMVLKGKVMQLYGEHVVTTQLPDRFKFAPEMEAYVDAFLNSCDDPERQLAVMIGFSTLTNQGYPVVPSIWKVVRHLQPVALQKYIDWLKDMFLRPDLGCCLDFSTSRQKTQHKIARLRKWIIHRLMSIIESPVKKEEDLVMDISRFCFFHAFFETKKKTSQIPETNALISEPLDEQAHSLHVHGVTADGKLWIFFLVEYANELLSSEKYVKAVKPFTKEQRDPLLAVPVQWFCPYLSLFVCSCAENTEPGWVEVIVEILLSLLAQPSLLIRRISKSVFGRICPNLTKNGLQLILDVSETLLLHSEKQKGEDESDEDLDDEAMMALDKNISALFAEQQKRIQAKKDERDRIRKEKILRRDFKIKVLDLIEVFLSKQPENPLVFDVIEPLLQVIEQCMSSDSDKQEIDFLQKTAHIFTNSLCRAKHYCKRVEALQDDLHAFVERLVKKARKHTDSSVALYYFSASLYLLKVLKGNVSDKSPAPVSVPKKQKNTIPQACQVRQQAAVKAVFLPVNLHYPVLSGHCLSRLPVLSTGCLDVERVTAIYQQALTQFLTKRNSALTSSMFLDLFTRFPVSVAVCLLVAPNTAVSLAKAGRET